MKTTAIERLYAEFLAATTDAARFVGVEYKARVLQLEKEICQHLASQGGMVSVGNIQFALAEVLIGTDRIRYFKVLTAHQRDIDSGAHTFARRLNDIPDPVLPLSAQRPSLRTARSSAGRIVS